MRRILPVVVAAALLLAGCATVEGEVGEPVSGVNAPKKDVDAPAPAEEPASAPAANPKFGETVAYENGISVTVGEPEAFTPSEFAAKGDEPSFVRFKVTVVNGSTENYDPSLFYVTMQSGNAEASSVFDSDNGLDGGPSTPILPGREGTWSIGFGVTDPGDLVMSVEPDLFNLKETIYTS